LLENIAERLKHIKGLSYRSLNMFRQFYVSYSANFTTIDC